MVLGERVPGLGTDGWRFVTSDANGITERVREYDSDARLVAHEESGQLGVICWFSRDKMGPVDGDLDDLTGLPVTALGGCWYMAFRMDDDQTDEPICGEPDQRVVDRMRRMDNRRTMSKFDPKAWVSYMRYLHEQREAKRQEELEESMRGAAEQIVFGTQRTEGTWTHRIFVPRGVRL